MQNIIHITHEDDYAALEAELRRLGSRCLLLVHGSSFASLRISRILTAIADRIGIKLVHFTDFSPNPEFSSAVKGIELFHSEGCDMICAVGGGSAMDIAKCIKLYAFADAADRMPSFSPSSNAIPLMAVPTTAGTGSEATRFAVVYVNGQKQSIAHEDALPSLVVMDPALLESLPLYQRKATMLDALCHAVESCWSVRSTDESREIACRAIRAVMQAKDAYLANTPDGNAAMLDAAFEAGRAINITQTTAGHAMCYKLTKLYGASHGHAAALCVKALWPWMIANIDRCSDPRGAGHLTQVFTMLAEAMGGCSAEDGAVRFALLVDSLALSVPAAQEDELRELVANVNPTRLGNNPVALTSADLEALYRIILHKEQA